MHFITLPTWSVLWLCFLYADHYFGDLGDRSSVWKPANNCQQRTYPTLSHSQPSSADVCQASLQGTTVVATSSLSISCTIGWSCPRFAPQALHCISAPFVSGVFIDVERCECITFQMSARKPASLSWEKTRGSRVDGRDQPPHNSTSLLPTLLQRNLQATQTKTQSVWSSCQQHFATHDAFIASRAPLPQGAPGLHPHPLRG